MATPVDNLLRLQALAEQTGDADLAAWLSEGLDAYLFGELPLEQALNLHADGPGKRTARCHYLQHQRNAAIRDAWSLCDGDSPWRQSVALASEVKRFRGILWPRWRSLDAPPATTSNLRRHLFQAHRCGDVPTSPEQLHRIALLMQGGPA